MPAPLPHRPSTSFVGLLLIALAMLGSCAQTRIERYYPLNEAPATQGDGVTVRIPYFKQSQRHVHALLRIENTGSSAVLVTRNGPQRTAVELTAEGRSQQAETPLRTSWTAWSGTIDHAPGSTDDGVGATIVQRIEPGSHAELPARWEFPTTYATHDYAWTITIGGLVRDGQAIAPIAVAAPEDR